MTATARSRFARPRRKKQLLAFVGIGVAGLGVMILILAILKSIGFTVHDFRILGLCSSWAASLLALALAFDKLGLTSWQEEQVAEEQQKAAFSLSEENPDDLHKLTSFYLKIGDFDKADVKSQRLIILVERD